MLKEIKRIALGCLLTADQRSFLQKAKAYKNLIELEIKMEIAERLLKTDPDYYGPELKRLDNLRNTLRKQLK